MRQNSFLDIMKCGCTFMERVTETGRCSKMDAPEALLAGNNDLGVLGDLSLNFTEELLVGNHVAAT